MQNNFRRLMRQLSQERRFPNINTGPAEEQRAQPTSPAGDAQMQQGISGVETAQSSQATIPPASNSDEREAGLAQGTFRRVLRQLSLERRKAHIESGLAAADKVRAISPTSDAQMQQSFSAVETAQTSKATTPPASSVSGKKEQPMLFERIMAQFNLPLTGSGQEEVARLGMLGRTPRRILRLLNQLSQVRNAIMSNPGLTPEQKLAHYQAKALEKSRITGDEGTVYQVEKGISMLEDVRKALGTRGLYEIANISLKTGQLSTNMMKTLGVQTNAYGVLDVSFNPEEECLSCTILRGYMGFAKNLIEIQQKQVAEYSQAAEPQAIAPPQRASASTAAATLASNTEEKGAGLLRGTFRRVLRQLSLERRKAHIESGLAAADKVRAISPTSDAQMQQSFSAVETAQTSKATTPPASSVSGKKEQPMLFERIMAQFKGAERFYTNSIPGLSRQEEMVRLRVIHYTQRESYMLTIGRQLGQTVKTLSNNPGLTPMQKLSHYQAKILESARITGDEGTVYQVEKGISMLEDVRKALGTRGLYDIVNVSLASGQLSTSMMKAFGVPTNAHGVLDVSMGPPERCPSCAILVSYMSFAQDLIEEEQKQVAEHSQAAEAQAIAPPDRTPASPTGEPKQKMSRLE